MEKFRIGISRDLLGQDGKPNFDPVALKILDDDPRLDWAWFGDCLLYTSPSPRD